jgi:hypothetical protein
VRKKTNGRGGVKGIEDRREYPVVRENREQRLNLHAPNLSSGNGFAFFVLSRGREKRQQLSARRKESNMKDQNKRIFFSFKTIAKNHFDRTNLSKDLSLYSNSPYLRQERTTVPTEKSGASRGITPNQCK